ncbi:uncharacterized protein LOC135058245 [Pseudophryne corroboree]|uniref:uncharacterized protein LOC135058245 n=1 Tax=Pseudophryne corroboree TaxID=495146 RepID=UPI0030813366
MKKRLQTLSIYLLYFQTCLSLASRVRIIAQAGGSASLPCNVMTEGDILWYKNERLLVRYQKLQKEYLYKDKESNRYNVPSRVTNDLEVTDVKPSDSGTFTCNKEKNVIIQTVDLLVLTVSAYPSATLLVSENLRLTITSYPELPLQATWWKDGNYIGIQTNLKKSNVQTEDSGIYMCQAKIGDKTENINTSIKVKGFAPSPAVVYMSRKNPVNIPFIFNFKARETALSDDVSIAEGNVTYQSKVIKKLTVDARAACWSKKCDSKAQPGNPNDLTLHLSKPMSGHYRMDIVLRINGRDKRLSRDVCVANITVSASPGNFTMESNVTLRCNVTCIDSDGKLCLHHANIGREICGQVGKSTLAKEITAMPETVGNWTCSVLVGAESMASANLILEVQPDFLDLSNYLFWVTVGAGVLVLLLIIGIITIMIARHRRVRRARYRAWLLENLHQHRRCECKGFAPQRLRDNI